MKKLEMRLRSSKVRKKIIETSQETERLIEDKKASWEDKGKAVYGDQWDGGENGNVPMRDLFELPADELREIKIEAYNNVSKMGKEQEIREKEEKASGRFYENEAMQQAISNFNSNPGIANSSGSFVDANMFGRAKRSHNPTATATFHDPRFVSRGSTNRKGDAVFNISHQQNRQNSGGAPTPSPVKVRREEVR